MANEFTPTDETRAILKALRVVASAYMRLAARYGVFGADCAGREPNLQLWLAMAEQEFRDAVRDVAEAKVRCELTASSELSSRHQGGE